MNSNIIKPEKFDNLHLVYHFTVPLSDSMRIRTYNHLVHKRTLNYLAKLAPVLSIEFLDIQATIKCRFTQKLVHDMIITYSQMHHNDKYSHYSSIIWWVWLNGWMFVDELSGCGFEPQFCHLDFRYGACLEQEFPWHWGNYRV